MRRILVLDNFQTWFLWRYIFYTALFLLAFGIAVYFWLITMVQQLLDKIDPGKTSIGSTIREKIYDGNWAILGLFIALLLLSALHALIFGRSMAGPIFAIKRHLQRCREEGEWKDIKIRKSDLFQDLVAEINEFSKTFDKPARKRG